MLHIFFRFEFLGEPALDAGGVAREFFAVICTQLFNPDCGLFLYSAVNQMCMQINPNSGIANDYHLRYFHMAGRILGEILLIYSVCCIAQFLYSGIHSLWKRVFTITTNTSYPPHLYHVSFLI